MIPKETIDRIKDELNIVDVVSEYVILKKAGKSYKGLCPFHSEKTPSFTVSEERQRFKCFGCGEGGDVFSFVMKRENMSYPEAVRVCADRLGIVIEESETSREDMARRKLLYRINEEAMMYFYKNILVQKPPQNYLQSRGISSRMINRFRLGYADGSWNGLRDHMLSKKFDEKDLETLGLIAKSKRGDYYDVFRDRLIFPILDTKKNVIGFGGRILGSGHPKYLNSPESEIFLKRSNLYGLHSIADNNNRDRILLVEGYMDVIGLSNHGLNIAVASLGTALTEGQANLIKRYGKKIYVCYDADQAGVNAAKRAIEIFDSIQTEAKFVVLPEGMDPDDFVREYGLDVFEERLENAYPAIDYQVHLLRKKYDVSEFQQKLAFLREVTKVLSTIKLETTRSAYIDKISKEIEIDSAALRKDVDEEKKKQNSVQDKVNLGIYSLSTEATTDALQLEIICQALVDEEHRLELLSKSQDIMVDEKFSRIAQYLLETEEPIFDEMNNFFSQDRSFDEVMKAIQGMIDYDIVREENFRELLEKIDQAKLRNRWTEIENRIKRLLHDEDESEFSLVRTESLRKLLEERAELNTRLKKR